MTGLEVAVLLIGILAIVGSFFITKKMSSDDIEEIQKMSQAEIKTILDKELKGTDEKIKQSIMDRLDDSFETLERKTDKETNDKIKEISQYSDTVLSSMNKSHDEIMFMYDMLNKKQEKITELTKQIEVMEDTLRALKDEIEEKEQIAFEPVEEINTPELESLKEEFIKKYDTNQNEQERDEEGNANSEILALAKSGYSEIEIAKKLGLGLGEVKLVLGLFKK
jgi:DNA-binding Xre family transcriptional regulator